MKILVIQTAFIGDAVLATALLETLHAHQPAAQLDILVRKGNESLFAAHPYLRQVFVWNKQQLKYRHLWQILQQIRAERYDVVVNCQRFAASGFLTALSGAPQRIGFRKNPWSWAFTHRVAHQIGVAHEIERNHALVRHLADAKPARPRLYPTPAQIQRAQEVAGESTYVCMAPTSVWFTKQWPLERWAELIRLIPRDVKIILLGGPSDRAICEKLMTDSGRTNEIQNCAGQLSLLESAALMASARMNYVNDSAPLHFASAVNAPVTAVFCSTLPEFGFTPLSDQQKIVQIAAPLACRPCGLHGKKACPEGHFRCGMDIAANTVY
jgi:lipopolysaccharide heptosyltransferase II